MTRWMRSTAATLAMSLFPLAGLAGLSAQGSPLGTPIPGQPLGDAVEGEGVSLAFLENQLAFDRVADARDSTEEELRILFADRGVDYPAPEIFLRAFKHERVLELWARSGADSAFTLIKEYPVCALPGQLGPKKKMGDFQVPEGFYFIDGFNPRSSYHLSLRVSYPNLSDRMRGEALSLGGDIFVHGGCETVGCIPVENHNIKEVYWLAARAVDAGQRVIPIHIFPSRMDEASMRWLERTFHPEPRLMEFWRNLAEGYQYFEKTRNVPWVTVAQDGRYSVPAAGRLAADSLAPNGVPGTGGTAVAVPDSTLARPDSAATALPLIPGPGSSTTAAQDTIMISGPPGGPRLP